MFCLKCGRTLVRSVDMNQQLGLFRNKCLKHGLDTGVGKDGDWLKQAMECMKFFESNCKWENLSFKYRKAWKRVILKLRS